MDPAISELQMVPVPGLPHILIAQVQVGDEVGSRRISDFRRIEHDLDPLDLDRGAGTVIGATREIQWTRRLAWRGGSGKVLGCPVEDRRHRAFGGEPGLIGLGDRLKSGRRSFSVQRSGDRPRQRTGIGGDRIAVAGQHPARQVGFARDRGIEPTAEARECAIHCIEGAARGTGDFGPG